MTKQVNNRVLSTESVIRLATAYSIEQAIYRVSRQATQQVVDQATRQLIDRASDQATYLAIKQATTQVST